MQYPIVPAIIPRSQHEVVELAKQLRFSPELHLDVVDGVFVPDISWPYEPAGQPIVVKADTDWYTLEVDLMVADPLPAATAWLAAGVDMLVFHLETITVEDLERFVATTQVSIGISLHGDTPLPALEPYLPLVDYVQLMGIYQIGSQGQPFADAVLENIVDMKVRHPDLMVSVDGSVNQHTIKRLQQAGADRFIVGSAIVGQPDPKVAHGALAALINS